METTYPAIAANVQDDHFPLIGVPATLPQQLQWLLELEIDGTIRYSSKHPQSSFGGDMQPVIGANFFDLKEIGDLVAFKGDFVSFVKGDRNRQTFYLRTGNGVYDSSTSIVLTRSFDKSDSGASCAVVLMELKQA